MKKRKFLLLIMFLSIILVSCKEENIDSMKSNETIQEEYTKEVLNLINTRRESDNLPMFETGFELQESANIRAKEISHENSFSSIRPDGQDWITVTEEYNVKYTAAVEYIASGYKDPKELVDHFMSQEESKNNILGTEHNKVGIGFYKSESNIYWELIFVNDEAFNPISKEEYTREVLRLTNIERKNQGLSELKTNLALTTASKKRSTELVKLFEHERPNGKNIFTVLDEYGIRYTTAGENIAYGQTTPEDVVDGWMNSQGHRENILNGDFNKMGVGVYHYNGIIYWTQLFTD